MGARKSAVVLVLLGLIVSVTLFGVTSLGRAGSVTPPDNFEFSVQPQIVTEGATGFVMGKFTAASGSGTGSATHVAMTFDLPGVPTGPNAQFTPAAGISSGCSGPATGNIYTCVIGTVNAGQVVKRFLAFNAPDYIAPTGPPPPDPNVYEFKGCVSFDNGSGGAGGGGGTNACDNNFAEITVVDTGDTRRAGNCLSLGGNVFTPPVSSANPVSTHMSFGPADFFLPCTWASVGEDPHAGFTIPEISFVSAPVFADLATLKISIYQLPLSKIGTLTEFPNYPDLSGSLPVLACPSPTSLPAGRDSCELPRSKSGNVTLLTLLFSGTGSDPGYGGG